MIIRFTVRGRPAPQGSKAPPAQGSRYMPEASVYLPAWRKNVSKAAAEARIAAGLSIPGIAEPVALTVIFAISASRPEDPPDLDKLIRAIGDGLKDGGLLVDDCLITRIDEAEKCRPGETTERGTRAPLVSGAFIQLRTIRSPFE